MCGLSLSLVLSLALRDFSSGTPGYPSPQKPTCPNSNLTRNQVDKEPHSGCALSKLLFIILFIYLIPVSWPRTLGKQKEMLHACCHFVINKL